MSFYRPCPVCGAALDPGEMCTDCLDATRTQREIAQKAQHKKETAPDATNIESGQVEIGLPTNISTSILTKD